MPPSATDPVLSYLYTTQADQTRVLRELSEGMGRVESRLETMPITESAQNARIDQLESIVKKLEHAQTAAEATTKALKTAIGLAWAVICALGSAVTWLHP